MTQEYHVKGALSITCFVAGASQEIGEVSAGVRRTGQDMVSRDGSFDQCDARRQYSGPHPFVACLLSQTRHLSVTPSPLIQSSPHPLKLLNSLIL